MKKYKILPGLDDWLAADGANFNLKNIAVVFSFIALVLGAAYAWGARNFMNPDGITYLDMGDAFFSGDWKTAINACWSPLYSLVLGASIHFLKPSLYWEFPAAHFANFLLYLFTLCCFHFFL